MAMIVIADDQATNREFLATLLRYVGHQTVEATNGDEALRIIRAEQPDLLISDIVMPSMDGFELVRNLRADAQFASTRVIFCTATYLEDRARDLARACGVEHILLKPMEPQKVLMVVNEALGSQVQVSIAPSAAFERQHLNLVNDKLVEKVAELEILNAELERRVEARTAELATANARLREINALKDKFVAITSHDLRSPLAAIQNMVEIMLDEGQDLPEDPHRRYLGHIYDSTKHLTRLVSRLLDLADLESGRVQLELTQLYASQVAQQAVETLRASAEAKGIALLVVVEPGEQPIAADWMKLSQMIGNLIGNAIKFTPTGGRITVSTTSEPDEARICVADTGVGIPAEMLSQLFEKSHLVHTRGTSGEPGTGLGLTIVSELAALHGGRVEVTSEVARGSAFTVHLPANMEYKL
jgi:signal transduction histidine kinase